jgi:hypothetical protein
MDSMYGAGGSCSSGSCGQQQMMMMPMQMQYGNSMGAYDMYGAMSGGGSCGPGG